MSDSDNLPVIQPASALDLKLPVPSNLVRPGTAEKIQNAVLKHGAYTGDGEVLVNAKAVPTLLQTDRPGANLVMANLPADQIVEHGKELLVKMAPLNQELSRRIQEPRDAVLLEALKYAEKCLNALRDNPALEKTRLVLESNNRRDMPAVKKAVLKLATNCISGAVLDESAHVHHVERIADQPRKSVVPANLLPVNSKGPDLPHSTIHKAEAHTPEALNRLAEKLGWPGRVPSADATRHPAPSPVDEAAPAAPEESEK